jgi:membrane protease YdiL (CAAX protease family)
MIKAVKKLIKLFQNLFAIRLGKFSDYLYAFFGAIGIIGFSTLVIEVFDNFYTVPDLPEDLQPFFDIMTGPPSFMLLFMVVSICFVAPITEELIFRGVLWRFLERFFNNKSYVLIITSVLFALAHSDPYHMMGVFPIGLFMGWLRLRSNSIFPSMLGHMVNNSLVCLSLIVL